MRDRVLLFLCLFWTGLCAGQAATASTRALIVAGLGGEAQYEEEFQRHANRMSRAIGSITDDVTLLAGDAASTSAVQEALAALAARSKSEDTLLFIFIGHGTFDGEQFRFNVPGRDFSAARLGDWLDPVASGAQVLVVTGAASGAIQDVLATPERTLITGTRSGDQRNATVFGRYFTAALEDTSADVNKDGNVTALEAFDYASAGVVEHYEQDGEMATENPRSSGPEPTLTLARLESAPTVNNEDTHLLARRDELEQEIAVLRNLKDNFSEDEYFAELQRLLLEIAMIEGQLAAEGARP